MERAPRSTGVYGNSCAQLSELRDTVSLLPQAGIGNWADPGRRSFGPNTFPAHNSALFSCEVQIEYVARTLLAPIIDRRAAVIEVKATAENQWVNSIHGQLEGSVFSAGCSNWYINEHGRNAASWPGYASTFWKETLVPRFGVFKYNGGTSSWPLRMVLRWFRTASRWTWTALTMLVLVFAWRRGGLHALKARLTIVEASVREMLPRTIR